MTIEVEKDLKQPRLDTVEKPEETLLAVLDVLQDQKVWVSSGTLLSLYRDGALWPHDVDFDLGVWASWDEKVTEKVPARFRRVRREIADFRIMQQGVLDTENGGLMVDIRYYYQRGEGTHLFHWNEWTAGGIMYKPKELFQDLRVWDSPVGPIPTPRDIEKYLRLRYGEDWRVPRHTGRMSRMKGPLFVTGRGYGDDGYRRDPGWQEDSSGR
jgi:hypothetical protein